MERQRVAARDKVTNGRLPAGFNGDGRSNGDYPDLLRLYLNEIGRISLEEKGAQQGDYRYILRGRIVLKSLSEISDLGILSDHEKQEVVSLLNNPRYRRLLGGWDTQKNGSEGGKKRALKSKTGGGFS